MTATKATKAPKTLADVQAANPYPSWAREVSSDIGSGLNVGALRAKTADASALAPFDVVLQVDDRLIPLPLVACEATANRMVVRVRLPRTADADALAALLSEACQLASG